MYYPDQITDSPATKANGPRRHYPNKHLRWEPLPDNREHTARTFRFADQSRKSQRSLCKYLILPRPNLKLFSKLFLITQLGEDPSTCPDRVDKWQRSDTLLH